MLGVIAIPVMLLIGLNIMGNATDKVASIMNESALRTQKKHTKTEAELTTEINTLLLKVKESEAAKEKKNAAISQYSQKQEKSTNGNKNPMKIPILLIWLIVLISIISFIWKEFIASKESEKKRWIKENRIKWKLEKERIEEKNRQMYQGENRIQREGMARHYYQNINENNNSTKGEITQFKQPSLVKTSSNQEEVKGGVWTKAFLMSLEWKVFEDVCMEYLRIKNCGGNVTNIGKDGGIDLKVTDSAGNVIAIGQCKAWNEKRQVNIKEVRELYGIMAAEKVRHGIYITTSSFTKDAQEFGINKRLLLINGDEFINNIIELDDESKARLDKIARVSGHNIPTCPSCNVKMVKKVSQKGPNKGNAFWGCSNYPQCKNTLQVRKEVTA
ncbi:MAG: restriction endonuclease [Methylococcales bacterium]|nr:restriction endonuclease [Methylococcales bacterium]